MTCIKNGIFLKKIPLKNPQIYEVFYEKKKIFTIEIECKPCILGQFLNFENEHYICKNCLRYSYSSKKIVYEPGNICISCFNKNFYCYGGVNISPKKGYWRLSTKIFKFSKCPNFDSCLGTPQKNIYYNESLAAFG